LRCQQVCKSWRSLLNRSAASGDACATSLSDLWGLSLDLHVSEPTDRRARTQVADLQPTQAFTVVYLITTVGPLSLHNEACLQWIAQRAKVFPEVHIYTTAVLPAQLMMPHLAAALKAAAALAHAAWQMRLWAGEGTRAAKLQWSKANNTASLQVSRFCQVTYTVPCYADFDVTDPPNGCQKLAGLLTYWQTDTAYIQQLSCLTQLTHLSWTVEAELGSLEDLQQLSLLQTLMLPRLSALPTDVHSLKFVQSLSLHVEERICSIESYTQLTHLQIFISHPDTVQELTLPFGDGVKLRSLDVWGPCYEHTLHLRNLTLATCLEKMSLYGASPQNIEQANLSALSSLTCMQCMGPNRALLQALSLCSSLQSLYVSNFKQTRLPSTFSLLTQLKVLIISECSFAKFPACLLHLSQLECLCVSCNQPAFHLSGSILGLARWPNLKSLDVSDCLQARFPVESQLLLGQLQKQLRECNSSCKCRFSHI